MCCDGTTADLPFSPFFLSPFFSVLRFPRCDGAPLARQLRYPKRCPQQPKLLYEPSADPEPQHSHTLPLPLAQFTHQHTRSIQCIAVHCIVVRVFGYRLCALVIIKYFHGLFQASHLH